MSILIMWLSHSLLSLCHIIIIVPAVVVASSSNTYYNATHFNVILFCVAYGLQAPNVTWKRDGLLLTGQDHPVVTNKTTEYGVIHIVKSFLVLCHVIEAGIGDGQYSCEASGGGLNTANHTPLTFDVCSALSELWTYTQVCRLNAIVDISGLYLQDHLGLLYLQLTPVWCLDQCT